MPDPADFYVMQDSDEGYAVHFGSPPDQLHGSRERADPSMHVATWDRMWASSLQCAFAVGRPVLVHRTALDDEWQAVVNASTFVISEILEKITSAPEWKGDL